MSAGAFAKGGSRQDEILGTIIYIFTILFFCLIGVTACLARYGFWEAFAWQAAPPKNIMGTQNWRKVLELDESKN
jgi:hypothetical protein